MQRLLCMILFLSACFSAFAETATTDPASIEYVDKVFADLQSQINALNNQIKPQEIETEEEFINK